VTLDGSKDFWIAQLQWLATLATDLPLSRKLAIMRASEHGASRREIATALGVTTQAVDKVLKAARS
jgi:DNA-directed RNA polymerase specialized sigma24 family protein